MSKRVYSSKLLAVFAAISSAIIIAGLVISILLGFQFSADLPASYTFEVRYGTSVTLGDKDAEENIRKTCDDAFRANKISSVNVREYDVTGGGVIEYAFDGDVSDIALAAAKATVSGMLSTAYDANDLTVSVHSLENKAFSEAQWRGGVALGVGAIVALLYVLIRYAITDGIRAGLMYAAGGLIAAVHDGFLAVALLACCRIPVFYATPLLIGMVAAFLSLLLWMIFVHKVRIASRENAGMGADELIDGALKGTRKITVPVLGTLAVTFALLGGLATFATRLFFLTALIAVAVCAYSSLLLMPAITAKLKSASDRSLAKHKRYAGKTKAPSGEQE